MQRVKTYIGWGLGGVLVALGYGMDQGAESWQDINWLSVGLGIQVIGYTLGVLSRNPKDVGWAGPSYQVKPKK